MQKIGVGIVGGGYMGKAHSVAMAAVGAVFNTTLRVRQSGKFLSINAVNRSV